MILRYFYDDRLAQASYLVGCGATGEALVIDPMRDIQPYLDAAKREDLRIAHITETHIHADYVSGSRELAAATGAKVYLSGAGGEDWSYGFTDDPNTAAVKDGDSFMVGNVRLDVLHTPGHTPEHLSFLLTDTANADRPMGLFTGDALFVGDVGRPDLLESAAGMSGTARAGARELYATVQRFKAMPDYLQVWPGHGAGSACGKALGAVPSTTLGYEKLFNPAFQQPDENAFIDWLLDGQPEPPRYFGVMKRLNKAGPALLSERADPERIDRAALDGAIGGGAFVLDVRKRDEFARSHIPGTVSAPASSRKLSTYVGSLYDYSAPFYLVVPDEAALKAIVPALRAIGVDDLRGYVTAEAVGRDEATLRHVTAEEVARWQDDAPVAILDVRNASEREKCHVDGSMHIPFPQLHKRLGEIPTDRPVAIYCASGYRAQMAVSYLQARGWTQIVSVNEDEKDWAAALPTTSGEMQPVG